MIRIYFIIVLLCLKLLSFGQFFSEADSLKKELLKSGEDTNRVMLLKELCIVYQYTYADTSMLFAREGLKLAQKLHYKSGESKCLNEIGNVLYLNGNYPQALDHYLRSLKIKEEIHDQQGIAVTLDNIGLLYADQKEYRYALEYFNKAKTIDIQLLSDEGVMIDDLDIGETYSKLSKNDSALFYTYHALKIADKIKDEYYIGTILTTLGNVYSDLMQYDSSLYYYKKSIPFALAISDNQNLSGNYLGLSKTFQNLDEPDSAIVYSKLALSSTNNIYVNDLMLASMLLSDLYRRKNNADSALKYLTLSAALKDSLFNQEKVKELQVLSFNEQIRQQEIEEQKLKDAERRRKNIQLIGIAVFIITFFMLLMIAGKRKVSHRTVEFLGLLALLLLFEFIAMFIYPWIDEITDHTPVLVLMCSAIAASILVPMHKKLEKWVKEKLVHKA